MTKSECHSIDEYIAAMPKEVRPLLERVRTTIALAAPAAIEKISYQIPTFYLNGNLVHFAAYKKHIGFYPTASGVAAFMEDLRSFQFSKGSIQFPLDKPIPLALIRKIVKFRVQENSKK